MLWLARLPIRIQKIFHPFELDPPPAPPTPPAEPKFSVIVSSHNYQHLMAQTLDSLLAQSYRKFEIIVVDDGSTDRSVELIQRYVRDHPRVVSLYQHPQGANRGLAASLRLGAENASGEYLAFCEADDLWTPDHLDEIVRLIRDHGAPVWIANDVDIFGDPWRCLKMELANARRIRSRCRRTINHFSFDEFRRANWILTFSACSVRRPEFLALDFNGNPWPEHTDWWLWRQMAARYPLFYVNRKLTRWRMHQSYVTRARPTPERWQRFRQELDRLLMQCQSGPHAL